MWYEKVMEYAINIKTFITRLQASQLMFSISYVLVAMFEKFSRG